MLKPCWRMGRQAGAALALAACCANTMPASDLATAGTAAVVGQPAVDTVQDVAQEFAEAPSMYRLPAVDEQAASQSVHEAPATSDAPPITPVDEPQSEPAAPLITILPPVDRQYVDQMLPVEEATITQPQVTAPPSDEPPLPALAAPLRSPELGQEPTITLLPEPAPAPTYDQEPTFEQEPAPEAAAHIITILPPIDHLDPPTTQEPAFPPEPQFPPEPEFQTEAPPAPAAEPELQIEPPANEVPALEYEAPANEIPATSNEINHEFEAAWNNQAQPEPAAEVVTTEPVTPDAVTPIETAPLPPTVAVPVVTAYAPTTAELSRQLLPTVRRAYGLAQHGAVYAAQTEFIQVLRRIAESKDAAADVDTHSRALAAGLRALDEADDFAPKGANLEADVNVAVIASAHRTPVLAGEFTTTRPAEAIALYHQFARVQLAQAVAGEQAGSMALYGLGKVNNRLARDADGELQHERKALVMFAAALDAGPGNHLAANEIGVLLSRAGYPGEASVLFRRAIDLAPTSTGYHNLAVTDRMLGYHEQAAANERYAFHLAQRDRNAGTASRAKGVQWVAPQELSRVAQPMPIESNQHMASAPPAQMLQPIGGPAGGQVETASKWPQKLVPGIFRR